MELAGRNRWVAMSLPVVLAAAAVLVRPSPPGALAAAGPAAPCARAAAAAPGVRVGVVASAWYRLDAILDVDGMLVGRRLTAGRGAARWTADLPPESFASGPVGGRVLVGDDDGQRSQLRLLDTARGCWTVVGTEASVIRSALLSADARGVYEHRVDRATRRDLGVWRRDATEPDTGRQILTGLDADPAYGPTFSTALLTADDGRLVASSCGERACRTRIVDPSTGATTTTAGTGPASGLAGGELVASEACEGLPCPVQVIDVVSGVASPVGVAMGRPVSTPSGLVVVPGEHGLRVARGADPASAADVAGSSGLAPIPQTSTSEFGFETPRDLVAVVPAGSAPDPSVVRLLNPASLQFTAGEVLP